MKFKLEIDCDNAAFGERDAGPDSLLINEIGNILKETKHKLEHFGIANFRLLDSNGNHVGDAVFIDEPTQDIRDEIEQRR